VASTVFATGMAIDVSHRIRSLRFSKLPKTTCSRLRSG
jgi:hypothetical protein